MINFHPHVCMAHRQQALNHDTHQGYGGQQEPAGVEGTTAEDECAPGSLGSRQMGEPASQGSGSCT